MARGRKRHRKKLYKKILKLIKSEKERTPWNIEVDVGETGSTALLLYLNVKENIDKDEKSS